MNLFSLLYQYVKWDYSFIKKLSSQTLFTFFITIILYVVAQITQLLAFFLPLKVLFIVASGRVPSYFRFFGENTDPNKVIILLIVSAVGCYFMTIFSNLLTDSLSEKAGAKIFARSQKLLMFENSENFLKETYTKHSRYLGALVMVTLGLYLIYRIHHLLAISLMTAFTIEFLFFGIVWELLIRSKSPLKVEYFIKKRTFYLSIMTSLNFYVGFGTMLYIFKTSNSLSSTMGLLCFILMRQIMSRIMTILGGIFFMHKNRNKINTLFYSNITYVAPKLAQGDLFFDLVKNDNRRKIPELFSAEYNIDPNKIVWMGTTKKNIAMFSAASTDNEKHFIIKVFAKNRLIKQKYEMAFLEDFYGKSGLIPELLDTVTLNGLIINIVKTRYTTQVVPREVKKYLIQAYCELMKINFNRQFVSMNKRTKPMLSELIDDVFLRELYLGTNDCAETLIVDKLMGHYPIIRKTLDEMPLFIYNPDIGKFHLRIDCENNLILYSWENWSLEPIGVGLHLRRMKFDDVQNMLSDASERRKELAGIDPKKVFVIGYLAKIRKVMLDHKYVQALDLVVKLNVILDDIK